MESISEISHTVYLISKGNEVACMTHIILCDNLLFCIKDVEYEEILIVERLFT